MLNVSVSIKIHRFTTACIFLRLDVIISQLLQYLDFKMDHQAPHLSGTAAVTSVTSISAWYRYLMRRRERRRASRLMQRWWRDRRRRRRLSNFVSEDDDGDAAAAGM